jgi:hypothetical protein
VDIKAEICKILDIMIEAILDRYRGLPFIVGADKTGCFKYLVERVQKIIAGWTNKTLPMGGKEVLLKTVS